MITFVNDTVHIVAGSVLVVLDRAAFAEALKRGKAVRRAQAQRAREAQAQETAARTRDHATGLEA